VNDVHAMNVAIDDDDDNAIIYSCTTLLPLGWYKFHIVLTGRGFLSWVSYYLKLLEEGRGNREVEKTSQ
jgi:hypothetical protein